MAGVLKFPQRSVSVSFIAVVLIAGVAEYGGVAAQSAGCAAPLATLSPCAGYITSNLSNPTPPPGCCSALTSVVKNSATCLCQLFNTSNPLGIPINQTRALALPGACKITTPPASQCNAAGAPAASPSTGSSVPPAAETSPASSPGNPNAVSPSSNSPSLLPPTTSVGGISPTASVKPTSKAGALFTPSAIISVLSVAMVAISIC